MRDGAAINEVTEEAGALGTDLERFDDTLESLVSDLKELAESAQAMLSEFRQFLDDVMVRYSPCWGKLNHLAVDVREKKAQLKTIEARGERLGLTGIGEKRRKQVVELGHVQSDLASDFSFVEDTRLNVESRIRRFSGGDHEQPD